MRPRTLSPETSRRGFAVGVLCRRVSVTTTIIYGRYRPGGVVVRVDRGGVELRAQVTPSPGSRTATATNWGSIHSTAGLPMLCQLGIPCVTALLLRVRLEAVTFGLSPDILICDGYPRRLAAAGAVIGIPRPELCYLPAVGSTAAVRAVTHSMTARQVPAQVSPPAISCCRASVATRCKAAASSFVTP